MGGVVYFGIWVYTEMGADVLDRVYRWIDKCLVFTVSNAELRDTLKSHVTHQLSISHLRKECDLPPRKWAPIYSR